MKLLRHRKCSRKMRDFRASSFFLWAIFYLLQYFIFVVAEPSQRHDYYYSAKRRFEDLQSLNAILSQVVLQISDKTAGTSVIEITLSEISCGGISIGELKFDHSWISNTRQRLSIAAIDFSIDCSYIWSYEMGFFGGSGDGLAQFKKSEFEAELDFISEDYDIFPPHDLEISYCKEDGFSVHSLEFDDDGRFGLGDIVDTFEKLLRSTVEEMVGIATCDQFSNETVNVFDELILPFSERIDTYLNQSHQMTATFNPPVNGDSLPYHNFQNGYHKWIQQFLDQINFISNGNTVTEPPVNGWIRGILLDDDGYISLNSSIVTNSGIIYEGRNNISEITLFLNSLKIGGLDTFRNINLLNAIGMYTLKNSFQLENMTIILDVGIIFKSGSPSTATGVAQFPQTVEEHVSLALGINDIRVDAISFLTFNDELFGNLTFGSFLRFNEILPCILTAFDHAVFTELSISIVDMLPPVFTGFHDQVMDQLMDDASIALYAMYRRSLVNSLPTFSQTVGRNKLNVMLDANKECVESDLRGVINFHDLFRGDEATGPNKYGDVLPTIYKLINASSVEVNNDGVPILNGYISQLTEMLSQENGTLYLPGDLYRSNSTLNLDGFVVEMEVAMSNLRISNIDTIGPLQLLRPVDGPANLLNNTLSIGVGTEPFEISMFIFIGAKGEEIDVHNEVKVDLHLRNLSIAFQMLAEIQEKTLFDFPLSYISNPHCWLATINPPVLDRYGFRVGNYDSGLVLNSFDLFVDEVEVDLSCISCSSPSLDKISSHLTTTGGKVDTILLSERLVSAMTSLIASSFFQNEIDKILNEAVYRCPFSEQYNANFSTPSYASFTSSGNDDTSSGLMIGIFSSLAVLGIIFATMIFSIKLLKKRRHQRWLETLDHHQVAMLMKQQKSEQNFLQNLNESMKPLLYNREVPIYLRIFIPTMIIGNMALFLSGHLRPVASVHISGSILGQNLYIDSFFAISMIDSVEQMWEVGARVPAIIVAIVSIIWPYTKQLLLLFLWVAPPRKVSVQKRGQMLRWLDILGKWSMVDIFIILMSIVSFQVIINSPDVFILLQDNLYSINIIVVAKWGLYSNLLAQILSQLLSHIIVHFHSKTIDKAKSDENTSNLPESNDPRHVLRHHHFKLEYEASHERSVVRNGGDATVLFFLFIAAAFVLCGCALPSFSVEIFGLVGLAVENAEDYQDVKTYYSVFNMPQMLMENGRNLENVSDLIGLGFLASIVVITVFIVPLTHVSLGLMYLWFAPMKRPRCVRHLFLIEILSAWQYMEVFVLSIIITSWQLGGISESMGQAFCGPFDSFLSSLVYHGIIDERYAQCFRINAGIELGSWFLVVASLLLIILNHFVTSAAWQQNTDNNLCCSDEVEASQPETEHVTITSIGPRFTDYYYFATVKVSNNEKDEATP